jgi:sRNA-binding carbon storage regulator CsrA
MLLLSRAVGEVLLVGKSRLVVRRLQPSIVLVHIRFGLVEEFEFQPAQFAEQPVLSLVEAKVKLLRMNGAELLLGIDAPRRVPVVREELQRTRRLAARDMSADRPANGTDQP